MYKFKVSKRLESKINKYETTESFNKLLEKSLKKIGTALERTETTSQKIIKKNGKFTKLFINVSNQDKKIIKKSIQKELSSELISYVRENGYIELLSGTLTYKNHTLLLINTNK